MTAQSIQPKDDYELLDSGDGRKLERFGPVTLIRPCAQAVWKPQYPQQWHKATATFDRRDGLNWQGRNRVPDEWVVHIEGLRMKLSTTDFGHLGIFPETRGVWQRLAHELAAARNHRKQPVSFMNLFAYSGGATLVAAREGCECCHLDASRGMVEWARENATLNGLSDAPVRWIVDDVGKFLGREFRRGRRYDAILLDPPSFGRGKKGELYKIESHLRNTMQQVRSILSDSPLCVILTSHTPGFSPTILRNVLRSELPDGPLDCGKMLLTGHRSVMPVPSGNWACWSTESRPS